MNSKDYHLTPTDCSTLMFGKPGNIRDFDSCQDFIKSQEVSWKETLSGKSGQKLFIVSYIFASVRVFSSIQLVLYDAFIIMKSLCHIFIIDNNTSTSMM